MSDLPEQRYSRQQRLPEIGAEGQSRIGGASVAIVGCGALGSVAAELLARAGVGNLILVDRDIVQWSNLQRQVLYTERDARLGSAKSAAAAKHLRRINSQIRITPEVIDLTPENIISAIGDADLWLDASDNFEVRFLLNDAAIRLNKTWIHGGCVGTGGQVMTIRPGKTPCFRCIVPEPPPLGSTATCDQIGVLGTATTIIAALQTTEVIKVISDPTLVPSATMLCADVWRGQFRSVNSAPLKLADCRACGLGQLDYLNRRQLPEPVVLCGQNAVQLPAVNGSHSVALDAIAAQLPPEATSVRVTPFFLRFAYETYVLTIFRDGRTVVDGTEEPTIARRIRGQFLGV